MTTKRQEQKRQRNWGWIGDVGEFIVDCGEVIFKVLWFPFKILGRGLLAILEGLTD